LEKYESILIKNGFLLTMKGNGVGSLINGAIAIEGQNIVSVGKTDEISKEYDSSEHIIDAKGKAVLPGFVDGHIHTGISLVRGEAQDVPEIEWMLKTLEPFANHFTQEHRITGSRLGVLEALKAGTTTFGEIGTNMGPVAEKVFIPAGVRANLANIINQIGPESRPDPHKPYIFFEAIGERKFKEGIELITKYDGAGEGRITGILSPHGADMMDKALLIRVKEKAKELGKLAHIQDGKSFR
jgi:5-methylthioadenosine/S-adenosylhomocysteine deaminase